MATPQTNTPPNKLVAVPLAILSGLVCAGVLVGIGWIVLQYFDVLEGTVESGEQQRKVILRRLEEPPELFAFPPVEINLMWAVSFVSAVLVSACGALFWPAKKPMRVLSVVALVLCWLVCLIYGLFLAFAASTGGWTVEIGGDGIPVDFNPRYWLAIALPLVGVGVLLVAWFYRRDSQTVGGSWATFLAFLRAAVIFTLFFVWLLPAIKTVTVKEYHSRVLVKIDVTDSMRSGEEPGNDIPGYIPRTRQHNLIEFFSGTLPAPSKATEATGEKPLGFVDALLKRNALYCWRFGDGPDEKEWVLVGPAGTFDWARKLVPLARPVLGEPVLRDTLDELDAAEQKLAKLKAEVRRELVVDELERAANEHPRKRDKLQALRKVILDDPVHAMADFAKRHAGSHEAGKPLSDLRHGFFDDPAQALARVMADPELPQPIRDELEQIKQKVIDIPARAIDELAADERDLAAMLGRVKELIVTPKAAVEKAVEADAKFKERLDRRRLQLVEDLERALTEGQQLRERLLARTNLGGSLLPIIQKQSRNLVQGMIVFSDGRVNAGSSRDIDAAIQIAREAGIPIITVGLGRHQESQNIRLADTLVPVQVQPEDEFPIRVVVEGEGEKLPESLPVNVVVEMRFEKESMAKLPPLVQTITLAKSSGRVANGVAEFRVAPIKVLAQARGLAIPTTKDEIEKFRAEVLGEWKFVARVEATPNEPLIGERVKSDNKAEEPAIVKVVDRKLTVLMVAGAPMREYQFLRDMLLREPDKFDLSIVLQSAQGDNIVQGVDASRLLQRFPDNLGEPDGDWYNLGNYDVVVAFDADWRRLTPQAQTNLARWVESKFAGGLIFVAGPVHTFLIPRERDLKAIQNLLPVDLDRTGSVFDLLDRTSKEPWALNWAPAAAETKFLDLTDSGEPGKLLDGWEKFFNVSRAANGQADAPSERGFYGYFPVEKAKPAATILARYSDPAALTPGGERQPYMVIQTVGDGKTFVLGSGEIWRMRRYSEKFHERFWTKLIRHMKTDTKATRRGSLLVGTRYLEGDTVEVEVQLFTPDMKPLTPDLLPQGADRKPNPVRLKVTPPESITSTDVPQEWKDGIAMQPISGRDGWYRARFPARFVGKYGLLLNIPASLDKLTGTFRVEGSDPERDLTRPDFARLHRLATPVAKVQLLEETKQKRDALRAALERAKLVMDAQQKAAPVNRPDSITMTPENGEERMFFVLDAEHAADASKWIPECFDSRVEVERLPGKTHDVWDKGWDVFLDIYHPEKSSGWPWAVILLVTLLSGEWLTRKLLKLA